MMLIGVFIIIMIVAGDIGSFVGVVPQLVTGVRRSIGGVVRV